MATVEERFWSKVQKTDGCWPWKAGHSDGYGRFWANGKTDSAHTFAYQLLVGPVPEGLQLDHLCRNRSCVNPDHLEAVTCRVNILRGEGRAAVRARQTRCLNGHELSGSNLYVNSRGHRDCRRCRLDASRRYRARKKAAV